MSGDGLDALFRSCRRDLERFFRRRVGSPEAAGDLTQEAFLRLLRAGPTAALQDPRAYLFRTARNLVVDHYRAAPARSAEPLTDAAWLGLPADTPSPERTLLSREELAVLRRAVAELSPREREVFLLHKFEGLSYAEIARRLGIARNTVVVHMVRALARCRARLEAHRRDQAGEP
ncbi:RNA polymerase sigma-70 factor, ECF subfamily [Tistlia consotensis]|uniref:RNA polymerase sigma-70 factor, ECF subfamily n=1 Tax=Tistlia consotensis USBA 355 TaxID=560819 RepID=A0A1Y6BIM0_9PROT|nr:sigma-70 family RNA polymerase sigma factor [Tistlia consotensis]SMF13583.1 RNA polymerase sigma-70 factor, ECF subfamily [Tistlia consotensis USBA 355]SNR50371.1 RNA polymerase sigma-70 factor, ECF subfamily [Tistlia consotensis]